MALYSVRFANLNALYMPDETAVNEMGTGQPAREVEGSENFIVTTFDNTYPALVKDEQKEQKSEPAQEENPENNAKDTGAEAPSNPITKRHQKRIDKLTREKYELRRELDEAKAKIAQQQPKEPKVDSFDNYDDYLTARDSWREEKQKVSQNAPQGNTIYADALQVLNETYEFGIAKHKDFLKIITSSDLPLTPDVCVVVSECDAPEDVLYYLGTHNEECKKIAELPTPRAQAIAIGKIEAKLSQQPKNEEIKKASKTPPPINPVGSGGDTMKKPIAEMSFAEFEAYEKQNSKTYGRW